LLYPLHPALAIKTRWNHLHTRPDFPLPDDLLHCRPPACAEWVPSRQEHLDTRRPVFILVRRIAIHHV